MILDGALATELENRGADLKDALWSAKLLLQNPELIRQVHYDYFVAGADLAITATYQATFEGLAACGINRKKAVEIFQLSVTLAKEARTNFWQNHENQLQRLRPIIAASIGPYGASLADGSEYHGRYGLSKRALIDFHRPRMEILVNSEVDVLAFETIPSLLEAEALIHLLEEFQNIYAWLSFSCCDEQHISHGELLSECVNLANASDQIVAVGVNCTPPKYIDSLIDEARKETAKPIIVYPNSGEQWDAKKHCWVAEADKTDLGKRARSWFEKGAQLIGGCCRTQPRDIATIRQKLVNTMIY